MKTYPLFKSQNRFFKGLFVLGSLFLLACGPGQQMTFQSNPYRYEVCVNDIETQYDGRFSIGADGKNLTYSWFGNQATWVTSHFVVRLYDKYGSFDGLDSAQNFIAANYPLTVRGTEHDLNQYLKGNLISSGPSYARKTVVSYNVEGIAIRQELTPVLANRNEIKWRWQRPVLYKVKYTLVNNDTVRNKIGFQARLDPQLKSSDNCMLEPFTYREKLGRIKNALESLPDTLHPDITNISQKKNWKDITNGIRIHEDSVVNPESMMGFVYTGNRRDNFQPKRIQLGSWNDQQKQLWNIPRRNGKYYDSGLIMEWEMDLKPGESKEIVYYYGVYKPRWGERVFKKMPKQRAAVQMVHQIPVDYLDENYLTIRQDSAWIGDSVEVEWNVYHRECCPDKLDMLETNVDGLDLYSGRIFMPVGCTDEEYFMSLRLEKSKVRAIWRDQLHPSLPEIPDDENALTSGLFTLGANNQSLLFGYPYKSTTSHFILSSRDHVEMPMMTRGIETDGNARTASRMQSSYFASNEREVVKGVRLSPEQTLKPDFPTSQMELVKGYSTDIQGNILFPITKGVDSVYLEQRITPYDKNFKPVKGDSIGAFYRVDYIVRNASCEKVREFDLAFMLDPTLSEDEIGLIKVGETTLPVEESFSMDEPDQLQILPVKEEGALPLDIVFGVGDTRKPRAVYNTLWQAQRRRVSGVSEDLSILSDRALFFQWGTDTLGPGEKAYHSFMIGTKQAPQSDLIYTENPNHQAVLWFDRDHDTLIRGEVRILDQAYKKFLIEPSEKEKEEGAAYYSHVVLEGFTGSLGTDRYNLDLANRRLKHVIGLLLERGIPRDRILTKLNGEYYAQDEPIRQRIRNSERVVLMKIFMTKGKKTDEEIDVLEIGDGK